MIYILFSDLHMQDGGLRDDFQPHYKKYLSMLTDMPTDIIPVALGDIIDIQRMVSRKVNACQAVMESVKFYSQFWAWFARHQGIYIIGNHDIALKDSSNRIYLPQSITFCERMILGGLYLCHGHEFDLFCSRFKSVSEVLIKIGNFVGRHSPGLEDKISRIVDRLSGVGRHANDIIVKSVALDFISGMKDSIGIAMGHTHKSCGRYDPQKDRWYLNTGTPLDGDYKFILWNDQTRKFACLDSKLNKNLGIIP